jgi:hypothetical protein
MPTCKKCNQKYPCWVEIDGKQRNLGTRKFCLDCSPFGSHNTRDLTIPKKDKKQRNLRTFTCKICKKEKTAYNTGYTCNTCRASKKRKDNKLKALEFMGGSKCSKCGYDKCHFALDFHHIDEDKKKFTLSAHWNYSWQKLLPEIKKCVVLCRNCHAELHAGLAL